MIKKEFALFEDTLTSKEKPDLKKNFRIVNALYKEACSMKAFPLADPLAGIETDIKLARALNRV